jgi:hypothetical protein
MNMNMVMGGRRRRKRRGSEASLENEGEFDGRKFCH